VNSYKTEIDFIINKFVMFYTIRAIYLLEFDSFPSFEECKDYLTPFNPFACNLYLSLKDPESFVSLSDKQFYFQNFIQCFFQIINRCSTNKFLEREQSELRYFDPEYIFDRTAAMDVYRLILEPTTQDLKLMNKFIDVSMRTKEMIIHIFAYFNDVYIFVPYSCIPTPSIEVPGSSASEILYNKEELFRFFYDYHKLPEVIENSFTICLWAGDEIFSAWSLCELMCALRLSSYYIYEVTFNDHRHWQLNLPELLQQEFVINSTQQRGTLYQRRSTASVPTAIIDNNQSNSTHSQQALSSNISQIPDYAVFRPFQQFEEKQFAKEKSTSKKKKKHAKEKKHHGSSQDASSTVLSLEYLRNPKKLPSFIFQLFDEKIYSNIDNILAVFDSSQVLLTSYPRNISPQQYNGSANINNNDNNDNGDKRTSQFDLKSIASLLSLFYSKYANSKLFSPSYLTHIPRDYRSKILTHLKALFAGGFVMFNPIFYDYVALPVTRYSGSRYTRLLQELNYDAYYGDIYIRYFATPITSFDPFILLHASFHLEDMQKGIVLYCNSLYSITI
jgi:hypothetical protein